MTLFFLVALGSAWLAVLLPAALRARRTAPLSSAQHFKRGMQLIAPPQPTSSGRWIVTPKASTRAAAARQRVMARRKVAFEALAGAAAGTFVLAIFRGGQLWQLHLFADAAIFSYAVVLVGLKRRRHEKSLKIRPLPAPRHAVAETYSLNEPVQAGGGG